jgi:hypothetical protein
MRSLHALICSRPAGPPARRPAAWVVLALAVAAPAHAQLPDPYTVPRGVLRVSFEPQWTSFAELYDAAGTRRPLGFYYSADTLGANILPALTGPEAAIRSITGDDTYRLSAGRLVTRLDGDLRRIPFSLALGLSSRLTFTATVPLMTARMKSSSALDTTGTDAGWNPISSQGIAGALDSLTLLLGELDGAAAQLEAAIAAGDFDCPAGPVCQEAQALADRARTLGADLRTLTGYAAVAEGSGDPVPPFAPVAQSAAGAAIRQAIVDVNAALQALGQPGLTSSLPLPTQPVPPDALDAVLGGTDFGYGALPLNPPETIKLAGIGDVELGLRLGLATTPAFRVVLGTTVRLPTGKKEDDPNDLVDFAPADGQLDVAVSLEGAIEPGSRVGIWFAGAYNRQFSDRITRRIARPDQPFTPGATVTEVERDLGDEIRASLNPTLRLTPAFRAFVSAGLYYKVADRYALGGTAVPELEALTSQTLWTVGGGLWYRLERNRRGLSLPIEAGFLYHRAIAGSRGLVPKTGRMTFSLRLFYNLWGAQQPPPEPEPETVSR